MVFGLVSCVDQELTDILDSAVARNAVAVGARTAYMVMRDKQTTSSASTQAWASATVRPTLPASLTSLTDSKKQVPVLSPRDAGCRPAVSRLQIGNPPSQHGGQAQREERCNAAKAPREEHRVRASSLDLSEPEPRYISTSWASALVFAPLDSSVTPSMGNDVGSWRECRESFPRLHQASVHDEAEETCCHFEASQQSGPVASRHSLVGDEESVQQIEEDATAFLRFIDPIPSEVRHAPFRRRCRSCHTHLAMTLSITHTYTEIWNIS